MENFFSNFFAEIAATIVLSFFTFLLKRYHDKRSSNHIAPIGSKENQQREVNRQKRGSGENGNDVVFYIGLAIIVALTSGTVALFLRKISAAYYAYNPHSLLGFITGITGFSDIFLICIITFMWIVSSLIVFFADKYQIEHGFSINERLLVSILLSFLTAILAFFVVPFIIALIFIAIILVVMLLSRNYGTGTSSVSERTPMRHINSENTPSQFDNNLVNHPHQPTTSLSLVFPDQRNSEEEGKQGNKTSFWDTLLKGMPEDEKEKKPKENSVWDILKGVPEEQKGKQGKRDSYWDTILKGMPEEDDK